MPNYRRIPTGYGVTPECTGRFLAWIEVSNVNSRFQETGGTHYTPLFRGADFEDEWEAIRACQQHANGREG